MKHSHKILLGLTILLAAACNEEEQQDEWIYGETNASDTTVHGHTYRMYRGLYYPVINGLISPSTYRGDVMNNINTPGYTPKKVGGFGSSGFRYYGG
ncbi:hypothetical protein KJS94_12180 [Flavihumibacter rivuli]|uniref:hypothetical protein n=1 Tax=Flavihumibacter rivuli TaxID=2838156 RepID=UPI001BDF1127|nr:hypothetical protein [Flavihumibacter rivuli]ULQ55400.1 hypothetical protein KJS94_12180 [Flavihumibacter rivuli]